MWVVDPIDGTQEFISGIPEWCISVGFVENGRAVAGGICNPVTGEVFLGAIGEGVRLNGVSVNVSPCERLEGAVVLASRSEVARGEWDCFRDAPFVTRPMGSVAYKLALVAAGRADATWTGCPKNEWDIAAGAALVQAAGGFVRNLNGSELRFNNPSPLMPGLVACGPRLDRKVNSWLRERNVCTEESLIAQGVPVPGAGKPALASSRTNTQSLESGGVKFCVPLFGNVPMLVVAAVVGLNHQP